MAELLRFWYGIRQRAWLVAFFFALTTLSGWVFTIMQPPRYQATVSLLINPAAPSTSIPFLEQSVQGTTAMAQLAASYTEYLKSRSFTQTAVEQMRIAGSPESLGRAISTTLVPSTNVFKITMTWGSATEVQRIANGLADLFISQRGQVQPAPRGEQERSLDYYQSEVERLRKERAAVLSSTSLSDEQRQAELTRLQALLLPLEDIYVKWSQAAAANQLARQARADTASVLDRAPLPAEPVSPILWRNLLFAAVAGLVLGGGLAFLLDYLDDTVKSPEDLVRVTGLPALGSVTRLDTTGQEYPLLTRSRWTAPEAEAYRMLRTNLEFATVDKPAQTLVVTSARPQEGKTTTLINLAITMARAGTRVIVVDTDLRRPSLHRGFGLANSAGFTSLLLRDETPLEQVIQATDVENLWVVTSGPLPPNPAELLGSPRFVAAVEQIKARADMVLFDSPPLSAVVDPVVLADRLDAVLLVVDAGATRTHDLATAKASLAPSSATVLGVVMNKITPNLSGYYYYYYSHYYQYSSYGTNGTNHADHSGNGTGPSVAIGESTTPTRHRRSHRRGLLERVREAVGLGRR